MADEEAPEPVRLLRSFLEGIGIPFGIVLVLMAIGGVYSFFNYGADLAVMSGYIRGGAWLGLILIFFSGLELALGALWDGGPWQNQAQSICWRVIGLARAMV